MSPPYLPEEIQYLVAKELSFINDSESHMQECVNIPRKHVCGTWVDIVNYQLVCKLWRDVLKVLLIENAPVSIMVRHAPEQLAVRATKKHLLKGEWDVSRLGRYEPWLYGENLLINAVYRKSAECLHLLLTQDKTWDPQSLQTECAHLAAAFGNTPALWVLSFNHIPLDRRDSHNRLPVDLAFAGHYTKASEFLLEQYPHIPVPFSAPDEFIFPVEYVAYCGSIELMVKLLEMPSAFRDRVDYERQTLLDWSLYGRNFKMSRFLLDNNVETEITNLMDISTQLALSVAPPDVRGRMIQARARWPYRNWRFPGLRFSRLDY